MFSGSVLAENSSRSNCRGVYRPNGMLEGHVACSMKSDDHKSLLGDFSAEVAIFGMT